MRVFFILLAIVNAVIFFKYELSYLKTVFPVLSLVILFFYGLKFRSQSLKDWFFNNKKIFCYMIIYFFILLPQTFKFTFWSEEQGWITIAIDILNGTRKEILLNKSDYPSSFQSWPLALLLYFFKDPVKSSRITGLLYYVMSFYFISGIGAIFLKSDKKPLMPALFFSLSTTPLVYVLTGWHEITYIPLFIFGLYYYLLKFLYFQDKRALVYYAIFSGLCMWSLYMPCLVAVVLGGIFLISPKSFNVNLKNKIDYLIYLSPIISPFVKIIIKDNMLERHSFLLFDKSAQIPSINDSRIFAWKESFKFFFLNTIRPDFLGNIDSSLDVMTSISLGPISTLLFILFIVCLIKKRNFTAFYFMAIPFVIFVITLMFTNPNNWRIHFLYELIIIMCTYQFYVLIKWLESKIRKNKFSYKKLNIFISLIFIIHCAYFINRYVAMMSVWDECSNRKLDRDVASGIKIAKFLKNNIDFKNCSILYPGRHDLGYVKALLGMLDDGKLTQYGESESDEIKINCKKDGLQKVYRISEILTK